VVAGGVVFEDFEFTIGRSRLCTMHVLFLYAARRDATVLPDNSHEALATTLIELS
jgi:hypothetical protein